MKRIRKLDAREHQVAEVERETDTDLLHVVLSPYNVTPSFSGQWNSVIQNDPLAPSTIHN
jgi:hypothetical protein